MVKRETITIAQSGQNSTAVLLERRSVIRLDFPTMTSTAATMQVSEDNSTWATLGNESGNISIASPSGRAVQLNLQLTIGVKYFRVVGGSTEAGERTIAVVSEDYTT